jgi:uncharacterized membrane protein
MKLFGHPVHPMLVVFPLGLLVLSVVFDLITLGTGNGYWSEMAYWMIGAGVLAGLVAAPYGAIDWLSIPSGSRASRIGFLHGAGNVVMLGLFALSWWLRRGDPSAPEMVAVAPALVGGILALLTGWLGGELVDRLGVGVDEGAHVDAPSSLSVKRIRD